MSYRVQRVVGFSFVLPLLFVATASDWTQWRGPAADGTSPEREWNPRALDEPKVLWRTEVGTGHGAVLVQGERLYSHGNFLVSDTEGEDVIFCLDTKTGEEIWSHMFPCAEKEDPGPCATPLLVDGRLYTLSREGHFHCLDAKTGEVKWMHHLVDEELTRAHDYFAPSPVACGDLVVLNFNRSGMAFEGETGELVWNSDPCEEGFASPVVFQEDGDELILFQTMGGASAVEPGGGDVRWRLGCGSIPDPLFVDGEVVFCDFNGFSRYRLSGARPERVWNNAELESDFQSHVAVNDHAYGFLRDSQIPLLHCVSLKTGERRWQSEVEMGALIAAGDKLIVVDKTGELLIARASPEGLEVLSRTQAITLSPAEDSRVGRRREHACWTSPVLSHGNIYVRSTYGELVCIDVR